MTPMAGKRTRKPAPEPEKESIYVTLTDRTKAEFADELPFEVTVFLAQLAEVLSAGRAVDYAYMARAIERFLPAAPDRKA